LTATLAHHELLRGFNTPWVFVRVFLGLYFLILQGIEYSAASYSISTGAYGRVFFFGTGFHGLHVCLGGVMLIVRALRLNRMLISSSHHFGVEFRL
jgi:cytochrome c oxidase subunit 3